MNITKAQEDFKQRYSQHNAGSLSENTEAILFAKLLIEQQILIPENAKFCSDSEIFVTKSPAGYTVVGYYLYENKRTPFKITVCKINGLWYPSKEYVSPDTKSCSGYIGLWILISLGCTLVGIISYFLISAAVGL